MSLETLNKIQIKLILDLLIEAKENLDAIPSTSFNDLTALRTVDHVRAWLRAIIGELK